MWRTDFQSVTPAFCLLRFLSPLARGKTSGGNTRLGDRVETRHTLVCAYVFGNTQNSYGSVSQVTFGFDIPASSHDCILLRYQIFRFAENRSTCNEAIAPRNDSCKIRSSLVVQRAIKHIKTIDFPIAREG